MAQENSPSTPPSSALQVIVYWAIVGLPLSWGVYKTVQKSVPLFKSADTAAVSAPAAATPPPLASPTPA